MTFAAICIFAIVAVLAMWVRPKATGPISLHVLVPLYYLVFFLFVPALELLAGVDDYSRARSLPDVYLLLALAVASFWLMSWVAYIASVGLALRLTERYPLVLVARRDMTFMMLVLGLSGLVIAVHSGYYGLAFSEESADSRTAVFGNIPVFMTSLLDLALLVSWWQCHHYPRDRYWKSIAWTSLLALVLAGLFSNSKAAILNPILLVLLVKYVHGWRPSIVHYLIFATGVLMFVFPFVYIARFRVQDEGIVTQADYTRFVFDFLWGLEWLSFEVLAELADDAVRSLGRGLLAVLDEIVTTTGVTVASMDGYTYRHGIEVAVPRFIDPDKPPLNIGNIVAHHYGFIPTTDHLTNIAVSQVGEMYMNFGVLGVVIGMGLWGVMATMMHRIFGHRSWIAPAIAMTVMGQQEGYLSTLIIKLRDIPVFLTLLMLLHLILILHGALRHAARKSHTAHRSHAV